ncbi:uncharacterized protein C8R40DRAFT_1128533 [Lentinula edodes]|uniref:uncharacterized protein n=1 Tax=Lentinula edodes TaxID=5353 RepID=UPI001E8E7834|nr:uncharacterized protein C8R40DRAFT_1128533 [Lentinula edodes]KAH7870029.1 hypothetical protein C8R40DRAFT_1128533 [Lentinula edodes]
MHIFVLHLTFLSFVRDSWAKDQRTELEACMYTCKAGFFRQYVVLNESLVVPRVTETKFLTSWAVTYCLKGRGKSPSFFTVVPRRTPPTS